MASEYQSKQLTDKKAPLGAFRIFAANAVRELFDEHGCYERLSSASLEKDDDVLLDSLVDQPRLVRPGIQRHFKEC